MFCKAKVAVLMSVFMLAAAVAGCGGGEKPLRVAVLHLGNVADSGWASEGHLGAQGMAGGLSYVDLTERENVSASDAASVLRGYADAGYKVIFCHSYDYWAAIEDVAPEYRGVTFMWAAGDIDMYDNVGLYNGRIYEAKYLAGMTAGAMTKTDKIGFVAAFPISQVVEGIDAFARGVAEVNPDAKVYVEWVNAWYDPAKEGAAASSMIDGGCDVLTHHTDSYVPAQVAEDRGVYYISLSSDYRRYAPHTFLTAAVYDWAPIMTDIVRTVNNGTWINRSGHDWWYGLAEGGVKLAPYSDLVPQNVRTTVDAKKTAIISGAFEVFPGMSDADIRHIDYLGPNVVGVLP